MLYIKLPSGFVASIRDDVSFPEQVSMVQAVFKSETGLVIDERTVANLLQTAQKEEQIRNRDFNVRRTYPVAHAVVSLDPIAVGYSYKEQINQALRDCEVISVKNSKYQISYDLPSCSKNTWRSGYQYKDQLCRLVIRRAHGTA